MSENKIVLNTSADLYKLPINKINNTKLYDFSGKYYDKIYEEAMRIERSGCSQIEEQTEKGRTIKEIQLEIPFNTEVKNYSD